MTKPKKASEFHFGNKPEYRHLCQQDKVFAHRIVREFALGGTFGGAYQTYGAGLRECWIRRGLKPSERDWVRLNCRTIPVNAR